MPSELQKVSPRCARSSISYGNCLSFLLLMFLGSIFEALLSVLGPKLDDFGKENEAMLDDAADDDHGE